MSAEYDNAVNSVMNLPLPERVRLARQVANTVDATFDVPADFEREWQVECARRWEEIESGKAVTLPADDVYNRVRALLRK